MVLLIFYLLGTLNFPEMFLMPFCAADSLITKMSYEQNIYISIFVSSILTNLYKYYNVYIVYYFQALQMELLKLETL